MDKCIGPPLYEGLTQSAVLLQVSTHLWVLEEQTQENLKVIQELQKAVTFILSGNIQPPGSGTRDLGKIMGDKNEMTEVSQAQDSPSEPEPGTSSTTQVAFREITKIKKLWQKRGPKRTQSEGVNPTCSTSHQNTGSQQTNASLLVRARSSNINLRKGEDPKMLNRASVKGPRGPTLQCSAVQCKKMPDGSVTHRVKPAPQKTSKQTPPLVTRGRKFVRFQPPPLGIAQTPSSISVLAPSVSSVPTCPEDPFAKMLKK